jgi:hypothetical protein
MAKQNQGGGERSKVRLFYVEGDFAPGELRELTQAFTSAVRGSPVLARVPAPAPPRLAAALGDGHGNGNGGGEIPDAELETIVEEVDAETDAPVATKRPTKPRVYRKPEPVEIDLTLGTTPWREFATAKASPGASHRTKYLVAATWLHDHAKVTTISADHVFTLYKAAGWNFDIGDPTGTFRQLKSEGLGKLNRGQFAINHLGVAEVNDMKATA